jgi:hypothetical protein
MNFEEACNAMNSHLLTDFGDYLIEKIYPQFNFIEILDEFELWQRIDNQEYTIENKLVMNTMYSPSHTKLDNNQTRVVLTFYKITENEIEDEVKIVLKLNEEFKLIHIGFTDTSLIRTGYVQDISNELLRSKLVIEKMLKSEIIKKQKLIGLH